MDARVLPPRPRLSQYRKQAKELLRAARAGEPDAERLLRTCPRLDKLSAADVRAAYRLADAQFVLAHDFGFESWPKFAAHVEALEFGDAEVARFEAAADAIVTGDVAILQSLLRADPALIGARSTRTHHATLLHYLSANGVEDFRQRTPANAVQIGKVLLEAGAEVDALADTYGGGAYQTTLNLLVSSVHPARAGLHSALVELLVDAGAEVEGVDGEGSPLLTALAFHYPLAAATLAARGARVGTVLAAAGLGRDDLLRRFVAPNGDIRSDVPLSSVRWLPREPRPELERALIWAAAFGHLNSVDFLSQQRVNRAARDSQGFTALHWAAFRGNVEVVDLLLARGAPLEVRNVYGGTVLGGTVWAALNMEGVFRTDGFVVVDYVPIIRRLLHAGARREEVPTPTGHSAIDEVLISAP